MDKFMKIVELHHYFYFFLSQFKSLKVFSNQLHSFFSQQSSVTSDAEHVFGSKKEICFIRFIRWGSLFINLGKWFFRIICALQQVGWSHHRSFSRQDSSAQQERERFLCSSELVSNPGQEERQVTGQLPGGGAGDQHSQASHQQQAENPEEDRREEEHSWRPLLLWLHCQSS